MKNPNIARVLKYYRKISNLSVNEVSNILREQDKYAAPKTIYGWESGHTQPDADTLMFLCELYQIEDVFMCFSMHIFSSPSCKNLNYFCSKQFFYYYLSFISSNLSIACCI